MILDRISSCVTKPLVLYLTRSSGNYELYSISSPELLSEVLKPADVLLVAGNQRFSTAVKYLTQSTWSHAALYVGKADRLPGLDDGTPALVEADLKHGVIAVPMAKYERFNTRICRPVGLRETEIDHVTAFMIESIGMDYDLKNIIDLARYLLPTPPVPVRLRRRMLALGSGDPTRVICSTRIAQAFQSIAYPILGVPKISWTL